MKLIFSIVFGCHLLLISSLASAIDEQELLNRKLFISILEQDFESFKKFMIAGANPDAINDGHWYSSSAFCESTKPDNGKYLDYILENFALAKTIAILGTEKTPIECVIRFDNVVAFERFVSMGLDINTIYNPESKKRFHISLFDASTQRKSSKILWYLMHRTQITEKQQRKLVKMLERFGGFEGTDSVQVFEKIAQWLIDRGLDVNLKPPAPDPRKIKW